MPSTKFIVAQLGTAFVQDPSVSLYKYIKNNWSLNSGYTTGLPSVSNVKFDTKFGLNTGFMNYVVVESMPTEETDQSLAKARMRIYDKKRIQLYCQGSSAINTLYLMQNHIRAILNANATGMQPDGIDLISLDSFQQIITDYDNDSDVTDRAPSEKGNWIARSRAMVTLIYDLVAQ